MRVKFLGFPHTGFYRGSHVELAGEWLSGEERELSEELARYVLETFEGAFEECETKAIAAAPVAKAKQKKATIWSKLKG